jgi:OmpA-OmpF porin, OOP family
MLRLVLVIIFRLLLLGVGGGLAALAGVAIAMRSPNPSPEKPLVVNLLPPLDEQVTKNTAASPTPAETATPVNLETQLSATEKETLEAELKQIQARLKKLRNRPANRKTIEELKTRSQQIEQQLKAAESANQPPISSEPFFSSDRRMVSLPSDALFEDNQNILRQEAGPILDKIANELKNYPKSTIRIAAHTDGAGQPRNNRVLSFRQAQVLEQYLSSALGKGYRWFVVGYGETQPVAPNDTPINLQRNRRIEIAIE